LAIHSRGIRLGVVESYFGIDTDIVVDFAFSTFIELDVLLRESLIGLSLFSDGFGRRERLWRRHCLRFRLLIIQELLIDTSRRFLGIDRNRLIVRHGIFFEPFLFSSLNRRFLDFLGLDRFLDLFPLDGLWRLLRKFDGLLGLLIGILLEHVKIMVVKVIRRHLFEVILLGKLLPELRSD
jgi:hypothetical protein